MTTIAFDGKIVAVDRQMTFEDTSFDLDKVFQINSYTHAFVAGDMTKCLEVIKYLKDKEVEEDGPEEIEVEWSDVNIVLLRTKPNLHAVILGDDFQEFPLPPKFAVGSGMQPAMVALNMGADAIEAVRQASKVDIYTGLGINWVENNTIKRESL